MDATTQSQTYTVEQFLKLDLPEGQAYEPIDRIVVPMAKSSGKHENLRSELWFFLKMESKRANLGLLIHPQPVLVLSK
jgi:Uma2 family endonuclease